MQKYFIIFLMFAASVAQAQLISISDARNLPLGSTVTINGIVTSGMEFGTIRYIQDGTGGIALFSSALMTTGRGDNVTVTGITTDYQNLLEVTPVNSWLLNSSSNPSPTPQLIMPLQLDETTESELIRIDNVTFANGGSVFQGNSTYSFTDLSGQGGVVYIRSTNPLVGETIPASAITLYGICSQFNSQYQVLPRDLNDLVSASAISITTPPYPQNISTSGFEVSWNTNINGNAFLRCGYTLNLELGIYPGPVNTSSPTVTLNGVGPSDIIYAQAFSVAGNDTAFSAVKAYVTESLSSGDIKVYFSRPVDNSVANPSGNLAKYLPNTFDDTLKAYIDRSMSTLDIAIYSMDDIGTALIVQAINDAYTRGVTVRIIAEGGNANAGLQQLNSAIPVLLSPTVPVNYYGIMHNKFFIMDANDADANKPVVMSGSTNWSIDQLNNDRNNLVFIQDQSLAFVYQLEFEEMWGGSGPLPTANSKFGPDKTDNTPHELKIGGKKVENFFSPSDDTNNQILRSIESADIDMYFATLVFTRFDLAYAVEERIDVSGVYTSGILDDSSGGSGTSFLIMQGVMGNNLLLFDHASQPGIMHHKYLIVDQGAPWSDPLVLTGSHNWSSAANLRNDENTLIIHDAEIANQYYQEFHNLAHSNGGTVGVNALPVSENVLVYPNPASEKFIISLSGMRDETVNVTVTDISGKIISERTTKIAEGPTDFYYNTADLADGVYVVCIRQKNQVRYEKLIVHK